MNKNKGRNKQVFRSRMKRAERDADIPRDKMIGRCCRRGSIRFFHTGKAS